MPITDRLTGAVADRYRIERELGAGGMATVYVAEDLRHDRKVAIKVLKPELAAVLGAERFVVEIKTTAALQHPHILPLFDSGTADGFLFYVMPYLEGETIREKLNRETQFGVEEAVRITREVADALDYAHRHGVIHRDIKPENILLHDGRAIVMDFGIALAVSAAAGGRMTETGLSLGTPHYMSPEQATAEKEITGRSDIYSLASVLYEMLAGEPPHTGGTAQQIIMKILTEPVPPVTALRKSAPPNVSAALAKALEKLPADRFESARDFAAALMNPGFMTARLPEAAQRAPVRRRLVPALLALSVVLAAGLAWSLMGRAPVPGPTVYDVGLPEDAPMWTMRGEGFAVSPRGDFVVYQGQVGGRGELWYRSLLDATTSRIAGTEDGWQPAISPDGTQLAFLRQRQGEWTLEVMPVTGGSSSTLGKGIGAAYVRWLPDGRLFVVEGDGNQARWLHPGGGPATSRLIPYCTTPSPAPGRDVVICSGGGGQTARRIATQENNHTTVIWSAEGDTAQVHGSHFQVIDGRYLIYLTAGGDLAAAPIDLASGRTGRAVRLASGVGRREFTQTGTYAISASGTLVYALGTNRAVGHLVLISERGTDTIPVGSAPFLRFALNADGRRLAAVVEGLDGEELRIYDLRSGQYEVWARHGEVRQPIWSPAGDRLLFTTWSADGDVVPKVRSDSVFVGSPGRAEPAAPIASMPGDFEAFAWLRDGRVFGVLWETFHAVALHVDTEPLHVDTLLTNVGFLQPSPDGRWIAYNPPELTVLWIEPLPRDGRRFQVAAGPVDDVRWLSDTDLIYLHGVLFDQKSIHRARFLPAADPPVTDRRRWLDLPDFRDTEGQSFNLSPDGRVVYVRGEPETPVRYLRVVPNWVARMKRAVDEANR